MANSEQSRDTWVQPARSEPIWGKLKRPPLDWGDEEPDPVWERLYYRGEVDPPYRSGEDLLVAVEKSPKAVSAISDHRLMWSLGRCHCFDEHCPYAD